METRSRRSVSASAIPVVLGVERAPLLSMVALLGVTVTTALTSREVMSWTAMGSGLEPAGTPFPTHVIVMLTTASLWFALAAAAATLAQYDRHRGGSRRQCVWAQVLALLTPLAGVITFNVLARITFTVC